MNETTIDTALDPSAFGLFDTVIGGPASVPFYIGWSLLLLGYLWSLINNQLNAMRGTPKPHSEILVNVAVHAILLSSYAFISRWIWLGTQGIAHSIYPDSKLQTLVHMLKDLAARFQQYTFSFSLTNVAQGIKDSLVSATAMSSWILALVSHYQLQQVQAGVYNVIFVFGPLLIGAGAFGIPTARIWFFALLEVSSWSISAAALYYGLTTTFQRYLATANQNMNLLDTSFLDAINALIFLSTAMIIVPVITGRLLGSATLGELAHVQANNTSSWASKVGAWASSMQSQGAPRADSAPHGNASKPAPSSKQRPGD